MTNKSTPSTGQRLQTLVSNNKIAASTVLSAVGGAPIAAASQAGVPDIAVTAISMAGIGALGTMSHEVGRRMRRRPLDEGRE